MSVEEPVAQDIGRQSDGRGVARAERRPDRDRHGWQGGRRPDLPRLSDRDARRARPLRRSRLPAVVRQAAAPRPNWTPTSNGCRGCAACRGRSGTRSNASQRRPIPWTSCAPGAPCWDRSSPRGTSPGSWTWPIACSPCFLPSSATGITSPPRHAHRDRDRRQLRGRTLPPPAPRPKAKRSPRAGHERLAHPLRRARVQRFDVRLPRVRLDAVGFLLRRDRRDRRPSRAAARRR